MQSFWGDFAWLSVPQPAIVYVAITVVLALAGLGLLVTLARRRLPVAPLLASGYALLVVAAGLFAIDAVLFRQGFGYVIQGRSFMIGLVPFSLLLVAGLAAPLPYRLRGAGAALVCIAAMAVQLCSLGMLLESLWA